MLKKEIGVNIVVKENFVMIKIVYIVFMLRFLLIIDPNIGIIKKIKLFQETILKMQIIL